MSATSVSMSKSWFARVVDLFEEVRQGTFSEETFSIQASILVRQVQNAAQESFELSDEKLNSYSACAYIAASSVTSPRERASALVATELFKLIISTNQESLDPEDHKHYRDEIVCKMMIPGHARANSLDLRYIQEDSNVLEWILSCAETQQTPAERHEMTLTMKNMPKKEYDATQLARIEIGKCVPHKALALEITLGFRDKNKDISEEARAIIARYETEMIEKFPEESKEWVRRNLAVSWQIRARQLPEHEPAKT